MLGNREILSGLRFASIFSLIADIDGTTAEELKKEDFEQKASCSRAYGGTSGFSFGSDFGTNNRKICCEI